MPTYEYLCKVCGKNFEVVQAFTDDPLTACTFCGGQVRKVFGSIGITFKGSGFYRNDSKASSTSTRPPAGGSNGDPAPSESSTTKTPESPAAPASSASGSSETKAAPASSPAPVSAPASSS